MMTILAFVSYFGIGYLLGDSSMKRSHEHWNWHRRKMGLGDAPYVHDDMWTTGIIGWCLEWPVWIVCEAFFETCDYCKRGDPHG